MSGAKAITTTKMHTFHSGKVLATEIINPINVTLLFNSELVYFMAAVV